MFRSKSIVINSSGKIKAFLKLSLMLWVSILSSSSDKSSVEFLPPKLLITSSSSSDSSINCFLETFLSDLDFFSCLHLVELNTFCNTCKCSLIMFLWGLYEQHTSYFWSLGFNSKNKISIYTEESICSVVKQWLFPPPLLFRSSLWGTEKSYIKN